MDKGRFAIVTMRGPGGGGRGAHRRAGQSQGGFGPWAVERCANDRCGSRTAKACGPGARGLCVKACGGACCPTGRAHQPSARRRGQ